MRFGASFRLLGNGLASAVAILLGALIVVLVLNHGGGDGAPNSGRARERGQAVRRAFGDGTGLYCDGGLYSSVNEGCCNPVDAGAPYYCSPSVTTDPVGKYCTPFYRDDLCTTERHFCNSRL